MRHNGTPYRTPDAFLRAAFCMIAILILSDSMAEAAQKSVAVDNLLPLQAGVTLPVQLNRSFRAGSVKIGTKVVAKTTQRVPVSERLYLNRGATLVGTVVASVASDNATAKPAVLSIRFTLLRYKKQTVPVITKAIAIANFTDVGDTFLPSTGGPDRGNASEASWTTSQVGGDEVYRSGWVGDVCDSTMHKVGFADYYGVYALPAKSATGDLVPFPRAVGVFSATAKGLYGFDQGTILSSKGGVIELSRPTGRALLRNGDDLLLQVVTGSDAVSKLGAQTHSHDKPRVGSVEDCN